MHRFLGPIGAGLVLLATSTLLAPPASAAVSAQITDVRLFDHRWSGEFYVSASSSNEQSDIWVSGCDRDSIAMNGQTRDNGGLIGIDFYVDVYFQNRQDSASSAEATCTVKYQTYTYEKKTYYTTRWKNGTRTSNRSRRGNCDFASYNGSLLMSCLNGQATASYHITGPGRGVKGFRHLSRGAWPCRNVSATVRKGRGHVNVSITMTSSGYHGRQCWIDEVGGEFRYHKRVKVWGDVQRVTRHASWPAA
jgi:hypothetical protein